jgi:hypothetical protein
MIWDLKYEGKYVLLHFSLPKPLNSRLSKPGKCTDEIPDLFHTSLPSGNPVKISAGEIKDML